MRPNLRLIFLCFLLTSCVPPIYDQTTYGIDEFIIDSEEIAKGKQAIDALEEHFDDDCEKAPCSESSECAIDGDELSISLYCPRRPDLNEVFQYLYQTSGFCVHEGHIQLPKIGTIDIEGLSLNEIKKAIQNAINEEWKDVQVYVGFKKQKTRFVQVIGAKNSMIALDKTTTLYEVIAKAGLFPYANLYKSYLVRDGCKIPVDFYQLIHKADQSQNILMKGGDQVYIAKMDAVTVMLTGEIRRPMVVPVPYGCMPLLHALAVAGGVPFTGDKQAIIIVRGEMQHPKIYQLNWKEIIHQPNDSLLVLAGDVIFISETPLVQWNRFINQLQPSINCFNANCSNYNIFF